MKRIFLFLLTLLLFANCLFAQNSSKIPDLKKDLASAKSDSARADALASLCFNYSDVNPDTALLLGEQAMQLSTKIDYTKGIADSYNNMGWVYYVQGNFKKAEEYFKTALELFKKMGIKKFISAPLANLGVLYMDETEYGKSLNCFMQVLKYDDAIKDNDETTQSNKALTLYNIGRLYNLMKQPGEARKYFLQSLQINKSINKDVFVGKDLMSIGNTYQLEGDQQSALKYYDECLKYLQRTNDIFMIGVMHENIASSYLFLKNYNEAIKHYKLAKENYRNLKSKGDMFSVCLGLSEVYDALKDSSGQIAVLNEALQYATELNNKSFQQQVILSLSAFYKNHYEYKKAYEYFDSSNKIKDSLFTLEKQDELAKLQTQFETERKEKEIALLKKDQQLNKESLQRQETFHDAAYIIVFLLVLIGFLIINRYRSVQRAKRIIEIEQMRNNIARNLHDDIGSTLTSINILSKVALQQSETNAIVNSNMQKIKDRSSIIMESMNDIVWAINPSNDALDRVILRMKEFGVETLEQAGMQFNFTEEGELSNLKLSLAQRNNLYLIFKKALNNAIKYSKATEVNIILKRDQSKLIFKITDNGKGFDAQQQFSGNGLKNMHCRAVDMNASLMINSENCKETSINLIIPIP